MSKVYIFYNPLANNGRSVETIEKLAAEMGGELRTLMAFPSIFKGEHIKYTIHRACVCPR